MVSNKITCIAIDDEPRALKLIVKYCDDIPSVELEECFNNPVEAHLYLKHHQPDVIFVDIRMPEFSGIELVKSLEKKPLIVFTTAHSQYAVESYDVEAIDFLLKPFDFDRFIQTINKIKKHIELTQKPLFLSKINKDDSITVMVEYKKISVKLDEILFVEAMDNYIKIHTRSNCHIVLRKLKSILEELPQEDFIQVHKSFIVSLLKIDFIRRNQITIGSNTIPIGRVFHDSFRKRI